jgi:hypothetical protein
MQTFFSRVDLGIFPKAFFIVDSNSELVFCIVLGSGLYVTKNTYWILVLYNVIDLGLDIGIYNNNVFRTNSHDYVKVTNLSTKICSLK